MIFFFKQKTAYEMRISDWSSDVCSSDLDRTVVQFSRCLDEVAQQFQTPPLQWVAMCPLPTTGMAPLQGRSHAFMPWRQTQVQGIARAPDLEVTVIDTHPPLVCRAPDSPGVLLRFRRWQASPFKRPDLALPQARGAVTHRHGLHHSTDKSQARKRVV